MTATPVDAEARARVRDSHEQSLFIEAGAGTGKTTALVERVVALVAVGAVELRELAAITFTEAAAAELRDRIRAGLEAAADGAVDWVRDDTERARCRAALDELDDAALTTLHGFAQRLLTEYPLEAGLPPVFEVLDDIRARVRFEQRWGELLDKLFADPALEETLLRGIVLGLRFDHLRDAARLLHDNHDRVGPPDAVPASPPVDTTALLDALDDVVALRSECQFDADLLAQHIDDCIVPFREALAHSPNDVLDLLELLLAAPKLSCSNGADRNWRIPVADARNACTQAATTLQRVLNDQRRAVLETLVHHVEAFVLDFAAERRREGTLEFHDLLVLARDVLREQPAVRAAAASRWRRLLLDEFQDTDPLQIQLAVLLATLDPTAGTRDWRDVPIAPGALVVVGDPKQSIYRFRRADLRVYDDARTHLGLDDATLVENFRSVPSIVDFVNAVFTGLLTGDEPGVQAVHVELHAHRDTLDDLHPPVAIFGDERAEPVATIRAEEADDVAAIVQQVKREEWAVSRRDGSTGKATYADIAILIPSRTVLPGLEDSLERAGIPARVESQSLLFGTAEIRDVLSILTAIDDPSDSIAVVAALRAPAFGCDDAELAAYVAAGGRWDHRVGPDDATLTALAPDDPVVEGLASLRELWHQRWWRSISETVEAVVRERRMLELAVARRRPRDHWRRIRYFLDQARAWDDAGAGTLRGFVEWAKEQADEHARVIESVAPEPDDDAVRILTVHGAKGLEFPIVVLAGLSTQPPRFRPPVVWGADGYPEFAIGTKASGSRVHTAGYDAALAAEYRHDQAERLRLLYVAMTRARDHVVVSLHRKEGADCHAASVAGQIADARYEELEPPAPTAADAPAHGDPPAEEPAAHEEWAATRAAALAHASRPASVAATTLAAMDDAAAPSRDPGLAKDAPADQAPPWRRGRAGTAVGRAVHAVLQTVDLATSADLRAIARAQSLAEGVPDREDEVRALAESALQSSVVRRAVEEPNRWWREVPVAATVEGVLLEGFIDLLVETAEGLVVVDYKTDRVDDDAIDAALERYAVQGAAYALALEAALGRPVVRCVFVFARRGTASEREVPDLEAAKVEVRRRLVATAA